MYVLVKDHGSICNDGRQPFTVKWRSILKNKSIVDLGRSSVFFVDNVSSLVERTAVYRDFKGISGKT